MRKRGSICIQVTICPGGIVRLFPESSSSSLGRSTSLSEFALSSTLLPLILAVESGRSPMRGNVAAKQHGTKAHYPSMLHRDNSYTFIVVQMPVDDTLWKHQLLPKGQMILLAKRPDVV